MVSFVMLKTPSLRRAPSNPHTGHVSLLPQRDMFRPERLYPREGKMLLQFGQNTGRRTTKCPRSFRTRYFCRALHARNLRARCLQRVTRPTGGATIPADHNAGQRHGWNVGATTLQGNTASCGSHIKKGTGGCPIPLRRGPGGKSTHAPCKRIRLCTGFVGRQVLTPPPEDFFAGGIPRAPEHRRNEGGERELV
jgi:hypothetical protein